jgi:hypothetical protein
MHAKGKNLFTAVGIAALLALAGCASGTKSETSQPIVGVALDVPDHFKVVVSGIGKSADPKPGEKCRNPMVDPRDKTLLELRRSSGATGDYRVQGEKYGLTSQQLLRVDCGTGKAVGIVDE